MPTSPHTKKQIICVVHGDYFTTIGTKHNLDWFEAEIQKRYAVTLRGRLGSGTEDNKEATLLNRVIRWIDEVDIEMEADPRQAERLISQLGVRRS